jgi:hypothetical protein
MARKGVAVSTWEDIFLLVVPVLPLGKRLGRNFCNGGLAVLNLVEMTRRLHIVTALTQRIELFLGQREPIRLLRAVEDVLSERDLQTAAWIRICWANTEHGSWMVSALVLRQRQASEIEASPEVFL